MIYKNFYNKGIGKTEGCSLNGILSNASAYIKKVVSFYKNKFGEDLPSKVAGSYSGGEISI